LSKAIKLAAQSLYGSNVLTVKEYRMKAVKRMRKNGILNTKLKGFTFNLNYKDYNDFRNDFVCGKVGLDPELYLAESLFTELRRPMI
jgi:hypothetical protein